MFTLTATLLQFNFITQLTLLNKSNKILLRTVVSLCKHGNYGQIVTVLIPVFPILRISKRFTPGGKVVTRLSDITLKEFSKKIGLPSIQTVGYMKCENQDSHVVTSNDIVNFHKNLYEQFKSYQDLLSSAAKHTIITYPDFIKPFWMPEILFKELQEERKQILKKLLDNENNNVSTLQQPSKFIQTQQENIIEENKEWALSTASTANNPNPNQGVTNINYDQRKFIPQEKVLEIYKFEQEQLYCDILNNLLENEDKEKHPSVTLGLLHIYSQLLERKTQLNKLLNKKKDEELFPFTEKNNILLANLEKYMEKTFPTEVSLIEEMGKTRDQYEFDQLYLGKPEPFTEVETRIKKFLTVSRPARCFTPEDYTNEIVRNKEGAFILKEYGKDLTIKELLEILRRCGLIVNNDASYYNQMPRPEGQGFKVFAPAYQHLAKMPHNKELNQHVLSKEEIDYITTCIEDKNYKVMVSVEMPQNAVILDGIKLHANIVVTHPTDKTKIFILGFFTSADDMGETIQISTQQQFWDIAKTEDKSKLPQIVEDPVERDDSEETVDKKQYIRFCKNILVASAEDFLENTLATTYATKKSNNEGVPIAELILKHFKTFIDQVKDKPVMGSSTDFNAEILCKLGRSYFETKEKENQSLLQLLEKELNMKCSGGKSGIRNVALEKILLKELEKEKAVYFKKQKQRSYEKKVGELRLEWKFLINIKNLLAHQKKQFEEAKKKKEQEAINLANKKEALRKKKANKNKEDENTTINE